MGNCIIQQNKIMQTGWDVTEHKELVKVHQVLPDLPPVVQHLQQDIDMVSGQMYYPGPLPVPLLEFNKKPVTEAESESEGNNGVLRIKLVITKQELEVILRKGGVSVCDLVSHTNTDRADVIDDEDKRNCGRWKPVLDSIPELN